MKVLLKRLWFAPNSQRFKKSEPKDMPVEIPDELCDNLPRDAMIVPDAPVAAPVAEPVAGSTRGR